MDAREKLSEIRREEKVLTIFSAAVILIVLAACIPTIFFTFQGISSSQPAEQSTPTTSAPTTTMALATTNPPDIKKPEKLDPSRIRDVVKRISGVEKVSDGEVFILSYKGEDDSLTNYSVYKSSGEIQASEGTLDSPNFIVYMDGPSFKELEASGNVCEKLKSLMDSGRIGGEAYAGKLDLLWRFGSISDCVKT